jgi:hypothetical protein
LTAFAQSRLAEDQEMTKKAFDKVIEREPKAVARALSTA